MKKLWQWWIQKMCMHTWRPAITSKSYCRYCSLCDKTETLSGEEFYARFGENNLLDRLS